MRKRIFLVLAAVVFMLPAINQAADEYVLVMSKEDNVCQHMLKIYNEDLRKYGEVKYDEHEEFTAIKWEEKKYYTTYPDGKKKYIDDGNKVFVSMFDINNDGKEEIVLKFNQFFKRDFADSLYFFKKEYSDYFKDEFDVNGLYLKALGKMGTMAFEGNTYPLKDLPEISEIIGGKEVKVFNVVGGWFYINPFSFKGTYYASMHDEDPSESKKFLVILKFTKDNQIKDRCYFLKESDNKTNKSKRRQ